MLALLEQARKKKHVLLGHPFHLLGAEVEANALVQVQDRQAGRAATVGPQFLPVGKSDVGADIGEDLGALGDQSWGRRDDVVVAAEDGVAPELAVVDLDPSVYIHVSICQKGRG